MLFKMFRKNLNISKKISVDKGSKLYNRLIILWFQENDKEMHSTNYKVKSVVSERLIRATFTNI